MQPEEVQPATPEEGVEDQGLQTEQEQPSGGNPAWGGIREKLDPVSFKLIEDDLKGFDTSARDRIETQNKLYEPYKRFVDENVSPETIEAGLNIFGQINSDPEAVHKVLTDFLRDNGRLPETVAEKKQVAEDIENESEDPEEPKTPVADPRLDRALQFIEQQEQKDLERTVTTQIERETDEVKQAHPEYTDKDIQAISRLAALGTQEYIQQGSPKLYTMLDATKEYEGMRQNILTAPRPGNKAPQLVSPAAGVPGGQNEAKSLGSQSNAEVQNLVADLMNRSKS